MPSIANIMSKYLGHHEERKSIPVRLYVCVVCTDLRAAKPPPITTGTAAALLVIYTLVYVLPFYLSPVTRPSRALSRDAPSVIRARITSVSFSCVACSIATLVILTSQGQATYADALHSMGYWPLGLVGTAKSLLLTAILFLGPLYEALVVDEGWRDWTSLQPVTELFKEWTTWRNIIAGPFTEEVLFRSASVPLMLLAHTLLAIFVVHAFCNCMGFPRFWGRVEPSVSVPGDSANKPSVLPSVIYYTLLCVGAFFWWKNLGTLTKNPSELIPITI
ncbi:hypothetical protein PG997_012587 [Apiospora hydei]|uniref:Uncharacterized protein n=1 Tax=Apiospora hydei TaxID=1337664 RepID=A0ABR1V6H2_9PEZI